jgi:hypothetical protein
VCQKFARFIDDRSIAIERGVRFAGRLGCGIVLGCYISDRIPLRFAIYSIDSLVPGIRQREKTIGAFLDRDFVSANAGEIDAINNKRTDEV